MPSWKKVITSGSNAAFNSLIVSSTITGSISGSLTGSLLGTASYYQETDPVFTTKSASLATTGSNIFTNSQTIDGNIFLSGSSRLVYNNNPSSSLLFGQFDGSTIHGPYYQQFGNQYANISQRGGAEIIYDIRNNVDANFHVASYNGSTWTQKFLVNDNGVQITGSLNVSNGITSSLEGTASWANNAITADSATTATTATTATNVSTEITQNLAIIGAFTNYITYTDFNTLIQNYNNNGPGYTSYSGEVFKYQSGINGFDINIGCAYNSLLSHYNSNKWDYTQAWKDNSTGMLGFYIKDFHGNDGVLTEGYIVLDGANINSPSIGAPLWFYQESNGFSSPASPPVPYKTSFYNGSSPFTIYQRLLGHLCYTDGNNPGLWILRFKPSNDWVQI